jgi:hypothetical protein
MKNIIVVIEVRICFETLYFEVIYSLAIKQSFVFVLKIAYFVSSEVIQFWQLTKSKHYCGICKKVWNHSDSGSWVS